MTSTPQNRPAGTPLLSVNVDHVATLRQARGTAYPDPVDGAAIAEAAGAGGITVHLRVDRRHIQDEDVRRLRRSVRGKLNLEISLAEEMLAIALEVRPHQVTLVPERPEEITTEGGLDVMAHGAAIARTAERLREADIDVSLFLDPELRQVEATAGLGRGLVQGFEINTDAYTKAAEAGREPTAHLEAVCRAAERGAELGLRVFAGHGLTTGNVGPIAAIPAVEELNIGHWLISRGALIGLSDAVEEMLTALRPSSA
jgi:pyridoxine 5-phosphate synthase